MAAPTKVFARTVKVKLTAEQLTELDREATLRNCGTSVLIREALVQFLAITRDEREGGS